MSTWTAPTCSSWLELVRRHDVGTIYHLAALLSAAAEAKPQVAWNLNMGSLYNVLEVARQYRCRVFFPSSIGAFGPTTPQVRTPQVTIQRPTTIYGITKVAGELLCDYYAQRFGVDTRGLQAAGLDLLRGPAGRRHHRLRRGDLPSGAALPALHVLPGRRHAPRHDVHAGRDPGDDRADGGRGGPASVPQRLQCDGDERHARRDRGRDSQAHLRSSPSTTTWIRCGRRSPRAGRARSTTARHGPIGAGRPSIDLAAMTKDMLVRLRSRIARGASELKSNAEPNMPTAEAGDGPDGAAR